MSRINTRDDQEVFASRVSYTFRRHLESLLSPNHEMTSLLHLFLCQQQPADLCRDQVVLGNVRQEIHKAIDGQNVRQKYRIYSSIAHQSKLRLKMNDIKTD